MSAIWSPTGEERAFAGGSRLKEPEVRFQYRVDVHNSSRAKLFVRLANFELVDEQGLVLARAEGSVECTLSSDGQASVLGGEVWLAKDAAHKVRGFAVARFAVPLGERGRQRYREYLLQGRPDAAAEVDAELARAASAPPCARD